jgi:hypothetical protein
MSQNDAYLSKERIMSDNSKTLELVVQELQSRIGTITSQYETQMAILKAQVTVEIQQRDERIQELEKASAGKPTK